MIRYDRDRGETAELIPPTDFQGRTRGKVLATATFGSGGAKSSHRRVGLPESQSAWIFDTRLALEYISGSAGLLSPQFTLLTATLSMQYNA
jgi:hypothetical protein